MRRKRDRRKRKGREEEREWSVEATRSSEKKRFKKVRNKERRSKRVEGIGGRVCRGKGSERKRGRKIWRKIRWYEENVKEKEKRRNADSSSMWIVCTAQNPFGNT